MFQYNKCLGTGEMKASGELRKFSFKYHSSSLTSLPVHIRSRLLHNLPQSTVLWHFAAHFHPLYSHRSPGGRGVESSSSVPTSRMDTLRLRGGGEWRVQQWRRGAVAATLRVAKAHGALVLGLQP